MSDQDRAGGSDPAPTVAAVVLAAGASTRFGSAKLIAPLLGRPLITHAVDASIAAGFPCVVVIDAQDTGSITRALQGRDITLVENRDARLGMASSIRAGVQSLAPEVAAAIILLGDQPAIGPDLLRSLEADWRSRGLPIVTCAYQGVQGPPTLFARSLFAELLELDGDEGARRVIERVPGRAAVRTVEAPMPPDIDTPLDLARLENELVMREGRRRR